MWPGFPAPTAPPTPTIKPIKIGPIGGPIHIPPIITITSDPIPQNIQFVLDELGIKEPDKCTCDIMMLMAVGCKCGHFKESNARNESNT